MSSFEELSSWILSFGKHAEVVESAAPREQIVDSLRVSLASYQLEMEAGTRRVGKGSGRKVGRKVSPK